MENKALKNFVELCEETQKMKPREMIIINNIYVVFLVGLLIGLIVGYYGI